MISLHSKWSILANTKSPLVATQAFKHTAPDTDKFHRKKWSLDRSPYPRQPILVKTPMVDNIIMKKQNREMLEKENEDDYMQFDAKFTTLEDQMRSLKTKGFLRPFRSYNPPSDMESRFYAIVADILQADVSDRRVINATRLDDNAAKLRLLNALSREFSHRVHNSRLHQIKTVGNLNSYYRSPICSSTPYQQLHEDMAEGKLPDNLVVQLDAVRFTGEGGHPLNEVTAFPRRPTVPTGMSAVKEFMKNRNKKSQSTVNTPSRYQEEDYN